MSLQNLRFICEVMYSIHTTIVQLLVLVPIAVNKFFITLFQKGNKMADDECDLEALLDVLDEDDDDLLASADHGNVDVTADQQEESGEEEEEIQRQLQEMEAKMRAMKEKLSKKGKNGGGASQQTVEPLAATVCGDGNRPPGTATDGSQQRPPPKEVAAASPVAARQTLGVADIDFRNGKSLAKKHPYTVQFSES